MFDTLNDLLTDLLAPIGETGRYVILIVAVALLIGVICIAMFAIFRQKWTLLIVMICVGVGLGVLGTQGYNVIKTLGEKQGDDFKGQISSIYSLGLIPAYLTYYKSKKKQSND